MAMCRLLIVISLVYSCSLAEGQSVPYKEEYFDQTLDHFNYVSYGNRTFKQRYLVQDKWWAVGKGPVFFYTGNEGDITDFWAATGFVFDIAPEFGALVVFAEHSFMWCSITGILMTGRRLRTFFGSFDFQKNDEKQMASFDVDVTRVRYYGKSLPFRYPQSFDPKNVGLLTMEQAMADYAVLITYLQTTMKATNCPVIAFGGSYGGMLSVYMRNKYPNIITGSIAASAPIYLLTKDIDRTFFFKAVTADFAAATPNCEARVRQAFIDMNDIAAKGAEGFKELTAKFRTCKPLKDKNDILHLQGWIRNSFTNLAMFDYPYNASFFTTLPANPVKYACGYLENTTDFVNGLADAAGLFYNGTNGSLKCFDIYAEYVECADPTGCGTGPNAAAWDYQACTEIFLTSGSNNKTDMFPVLPFTPELRKAYCEAKWSVTPRDNWAAVEFWGKHINSATNIVFSNGDLDPWKNGGVLHSPGPEVRAVTIAGGAHHLDLRSPGLKAPWGAYSIVVGPLSILCGPFIMALTCYISAACRASNPKDPISVIAAREVEKAAIRKWINS